MSANHSHYINNVWTFSGQTLYVEMHVYVSLFTLALSLAPSPFYFFLLLIPCIFSSLPLFICLSGISLESSKGAQGKYFCPLAQSTVVGRFLCAVSWAVLGPEHTSYGSKVSATGRIIVIRDFEANRESHVYF